MTQNKLIATLGGGLLLLSSSAMAASIEQRVGQLEKDLDEINERVDMNELAATLNKVKFGLEFNTSVHNATLNNKSAGTKTSYNNRWMMGLYLNMNADINKYTKFTGRLSMTKAFGDLEFMTPVIGSLDAGRAIGGASALYVERAYVDIYMGQYAALTLGRLPGTDGPGSNLRNGSARMSTYPALAVNALGDGAVFTLKPYTNAALRVGFSKVYQSFNITGNSAAGDIFGTKDAADANLIFGAFETAFLPRSFGKSLFMLTYINLANYTIPGTSMRALAQQALSAQNQTTTVSGASTQNAGDMQYVNIHLENDKLLGTGLNWFVSGSYYKGSNADALTYQTSASGTTTQSPLGRLFAEENGWAVHAGLRYDFGSYFKIGYEYFKGSKYWYAFSRVSINDPFNFRNTRGSVHDVYAIWQLDLNQFFRLSYTRQILDYATPLIPMATNAVNEVNQNIALAYILRF
ncbi:DUF3373 family protein [Helicobacter marmotae]|uniref:DUF3373 domain-containing protein n=1 Tax=Helicobacter marmotae TaxID=152490 RepID=A0A3D8I6J7_9HELI|nr:DUF3373 family protein [Helicobacter marmotae]RDU60783.1 DUF3373 domain-containing protein [Helicobacter marmotae]